MLFGGHLQISGYKYFPDGLLDFFEPVMAEQKTHINPTTKAQVPALHLYFDERDNRTEETQDYSPKGFTEETVLNDFPVRDKKLVLLSEERAPRSVSISPSQTRLQELQRTRVMMLPIVSDLVVEDILMIHHHRWHSVL